MGILISTRRRIETWLYPHAMALVCRRNEHHRSLEAFLKDSSSHMDQFLFYRCKLTFNWVPLVNFAKLCQDVFNVENPLFHCMGIARTREEK